MTLKSWLKNCWSVRERNLAIHFWLVVFFAINISMITNPELGYPQKTQDIPGEEFYGSSWDTTHVNIYPTIDKGSLFFGYDLELVYDRSDFSMPVPGIITSPFGTRNGKLHGGVDYV